MVTNFETNTERRLALEEALEHRRYSDLRELLRDANEVDLAEVLEDLNATEATMFFRMLPKDMSADVFAYLSPDAQEQLIGHLSDSEISETINELFLDDAVDFLEEMPANVVKKVLRSSSHERREAINRLLHYPEDSAGSLMTVEMICLRRNWTVGQSLAHIRRTGENKESIYTCYVTDQKAVLEGVISVRDLLCASDETLVGDIMYPEVISVRTTDDQEYASQLLHRYDFIALPVVDTENRVVGIITVDDALDVMQEEATEDMQRMAAISPNERPYLKTSVFEHSRRRIVWLLILMVSGMLNGTILSHYENAFVAIPLLVSFIPVLTDTGGNAGSQTSTLIIRGMVLKELGVRDLFLIVWREIQIAVICGSILALANGLRIYFLMHQSFIIALTVSLAMLFTVLLAKIIGAVLPILAQSVKLDPAIMAAPVITTIVDAGSLIIYFMLAEKLLHLG